MDPNVFSPNASIILLSLETEYVWLIYVYYKNVQVDQAVSMAFENAKVGNNYVRIQGNGIIIGSQDKAWLGRAEAMLAQNNVESVLFKGKKLADLTNVEKLDLFACDLIKEQQRRKTAVLPPVFLKQFGSPSPRTSSATTLSTLSSC